MKRSLLAVSAFVCFTLFSFSVYSLDLYLVDGNEPTVNVVDAPPGSKRITFDLSNNTITVPPSYDDATDSYIVPGHSVTDVSAPSADAVANGDVTPHNQTIGTPVAIRVPGTDVFKLADGSYVNASPSQTLQDAYDSLSSGVPEPSILNPTNLPLIGDVLANLPYCDSRGFNCNGTVSAKITSDFTTTTTCTSYLFKTNEYYYYSTGVKYVYEDTKPESCTYDHYYTIKFAPAALTSNPPTYPESTPDSNQLGNVLQPQLPDWTNNGLLNDFIQACSEGGNCTVAGGDISQQDVDTWITNNNTVVNNGINNLISGGSSASQTDGTNTGAQQQQTGQLAGIQQGINRLNDTLGDIEDKLDEGYELTGSTSLPQDNTYSTDFTQPEENSLSDLISGFISSGLPMSQMLDDSGFTVSGIDPHVSCSLWGRDVNFDLSPMESVLHWMGLVVFSISTISAFMIVIKR